MGTNYYLKTDVCDHCERSEKIHIGKSSFGWVFALHVIPEKNLNCLADWLTTIAEPGNLIEDEYGAQIPLSKFLKIIEREGYRAIEKSDPIPDYAIWEESRGLMRGRFSTRCVGYQDGCDLLIGEFS